MCAWCFDYCVSVQVLMDELMCTCVWKTEVNLRCCYSGDVHMILETKSASLLPGWGWVADWPWAPGICLSLPLQPWDYKLMRALQTLHWASSFTLQLYCLSKANAHVPGHILWGIQSMARFELWPWDTGQTSEFPGTLASNLDYNNWTCFTGLSG